MILTQPQYRCLKAACETRKGIYMQEKLFGISTIGALMARKLLDISLKTNEEGLLLLTEFSRSELKLNTSIHAYKLSYLGALAKIKRVAR